MRVEVVRVVLWVVELMTLEVVLKELVENQVEGEGWGSKVGVNCWEALMLVEEVNFLEVMLVVEVNFWVAQILEVVVNSLVGLMVVVVVIFQVAVMLVVAVVMFQGALMLVEAVVMFQGDLLVEVEEISQVALLVVEVNFWVVLLMEVEVNS